MTTDSLPVDVFVQGIEVSDRQRLRVSPGTTVRDVLRRAGHEAVIARIEAGELGLARFGSRARLDDPVFVMTRIEVMLPITADAKTWRRDRVAARRAGTGRGG